MVYSYDIFDTCLVRTVASPPAVFLQVASRVLEEPVGAVAVARLARMREDAEKTARQAVPGREITLEAIYGVLSEREDCLVDAAAMQEHELAVERECLRPVPAVRNRIREQREGGARILFISDMYLPSAFVREQLRRHGIAEPEDPVYVSSEYGVTKRDGALFKQVLEEEGLEAGELVHTGDHPHADVRVPRDLGIRVEKLGSARLSRYEQRWAECDGGGGWGAAFAAGVSRLGRLAVLAGGRGEIEARILGGVFAPLLTAFAAWTLEQAKADGIRRLYFVARDGELPLAAARVLSVNGDGPDVRYLYGSRQAWLLASTREVNRRGLGWIVQPNTDRSLRALLDRLCLGLEGMQALIAEQGLGEVDPARDLSPEELERFWRLVEDRRCADRVQRTVQTLRGGVLGYLEQEGMFDGTPSAIVDLGWNARCQAALNRIVEERLTQGKLPGYYFALSARRLSPERSGPRRAWFLENRGLDRTLAGRLVRNRALVEHVIAMPSHATTRGYERTGDGWQPVLAPFEPDENSVRAHAALRLGIECVAEELRRFLEEGNAPAPMLAVAADSACRFVTRPDAEEAAVFDWVMGTNDLKDPRAAPIVRPLTGRDLAGFVWSGLVRRGRPKRLRDLWLEGSAALSTGWVRAALRVLLRVPGYR